MPPIAPNRLNPNSKLGPTLQASILRAEQALDRCLPPAEQSPAALHRAMRYAVLGGGKRLRPLLVYAAAHAFGESGPQLHPVPFAKFFGDFERLNGLIEPIHLSQHISSIQTDRCNSQKVVAVFECLLSLIVMCERFAVFVQPVIEIAKRNLEPGRIVNIIRRLECGPGALGHIQGFCVPAEIHQIVHLADQGPANLTDQTGIFKQLDSTIEKRLRICRFPHGVEDLCSRTGSQSPSNSGADE